ncbi:hypothetical protein F2Q70_00005920 [Brassica cretica]|uniref:SDR family oxidoreductase n=1 Tax=Brassica cretica TaxID=69181 RepID=A0A8S9IQB7_BRACR|nr:hypothetical protein F2Q70_00005920 [Brassica cretica]
MFATPGLDSVFLRGLDVYINLQTGWTDHRESRRTSRAGTCRIGSSGREEQSGSSVGSSIGCAIVFAWSSVRQDANRSSSQVLIGSSDRLSFYRVVRLTGRIGWEGPVATEMFFSGKSEETVRSIIERSPFGRLGETRDIAPVVGFLASDGGEWINGQVIVANGAFLK